MIFSPSDALCKAIQASHFCERNDYKSHYRFYYATHLAVKEVSRRTDRNGEFKNMHGNSAAEHLFRLLYIFTHCHRIKKILARLVVMVINSPEDKARWLWMTWNESQQMEALGFRCHLAWLAWIFMTRLDATLCCQLLLEVFHLFCFSRAFRILLDSFCLRPPSM